MREFKGKRIFLLACLLGVCVLSACSAGGEDPGVTTLIYANLTEGGVDRAAVTKFNASHKDVQIEIRDYFDENGRSGAERLLTEMAAGKIPDIIDLSSSRPSYPMLARKGYLEDLWPYIENDPALGREGVLEAPLKAAEIDGGLYVLFEGVNILTLIGAESVVGDRSGWTLEELQETFFAMPEDSTIMEFYMTKERIFGELFRLRIDGYVDWETGTCDFTGDRFRTDLQFISSFPDVNDNYVEDLNEEALDRLFSGRQMLFEESVYTPALFQGYDAYFGQGGQAVFIGYPTEDGSAGSYFYTLIHQNRLAMSSTCQDKAAAWEFLRKLILPQYSSVEKWRNAHPYYIPVNRADYDLMLKSAVTPTRELQGWSYCNGPEVRYRNASKEDVARFEDLLNSITRINLYDRDVYDIVYDGVGAYFAGDKTLDETVNLIQNRVQLYVNENR